MLDSSIMLLDIYCSTHVRADEPFLEDGSQAFIHVESLGHAFHAFVNGKLAGDEN